MQMLNKILDIFIMWFITSKRELSEWPHMSPLHSSSNCILCAPWWHGKAGKKQKILTCSDVWPTYQHTHRQHLPLHDIISLFRDSRCDSWLFAYQSERVVDQECCHSLRAAPQRKQRLWESLFETAISDRVYPNDNFIQHSSFFFYYSSVYAFLFFLPPTVVKMMHNICLLFWMTVNYRKRREFKPGTLPQWSCQESNLCFASSQEAVLQGRWTKNFTCESTSTSLLLYRVMSKYKYDVSALFVDLRGEKVRDTIVSPAFIPSQVLSESLFRKKKKAIHLSEQRRYVLETFNFQRHRIYRRRTPFSLTNPNGYGCRLCRTFDAIVIPNDAKRRCAGATGSEKTWCEQRSKMERGCKKEGEPLSDLFAVN